MFNSHTESIDEDSKQNSSLKIAVLNDRFYKSPDSSKKTMSKTQIGLEAAIDFFLRPPSLKETMY